MILLLTTTSSLDRCAQLRRSLILHNWDFHFIQHEWKGFGGKILETYAYLKSHPDVTHFFYSDAWDTFAFGSQEEAIGKVLQLTGTLDCILFSTERACYPHGEKAVKYPAHDSPWKYVNGGGWFASSRLFIEMVEKYPLDHSTVDQVYFTDRFLGGDCGIQLDYGCAIFQTIAFNRPDDLTPTNGRPFNTVHTSFPIFIHGNGHTPMDKIYALQPPSFDNLNAVAAMWRDETAIHKQIAEEFTARVNATKLFKDYRDWIEHRSFGFGERCFLWMWNLIINDLLPNDTFLQGENINFLEIGVYKGQILGFIRMLAPQATITGITPLDNSDNHKVSDYAADIRTLHDAFGLKHPVIVKALSTDEVAVKHASRTRYDIIYIDGGHSYEVAKHDVYTYSSFVKVGGYLVIDDCAHRYKLPAGYFPGIASVSRAVDELLPNDYYKELFNVGHNRIFKRIR